MLQNNRILWVDIAKGIGILLVLIGHISQNQYISSFIYSFHMPLFFMISGYLYNNKKNYIKKKIKSILIPYLFFAIISFIYWYCIERNLREQDISPINAFINILLARGGNSNYVFNIALWFLPCLLFVEIIFHLLQRRIKNNKILSVIIFIFSIIGYIYAKLNLVRLPLCIDISFTAIAFYFLGYLWRNECEYYFEKLKLSKVPKIFIFGICFLFIAVFSQFSTNIDMNNLQFPFYICLYILPIVGFFMIYIISTVIKQNKILQYLGSNTLIIMGVHEPIKRIIIELLHRIFKIQTEILRVNFIWIILTTIVLLLVCLPIIYIINNYLPFLIGRKKEKRNVTN